MNRRKFVASSVVGAAVVGTAGAQTPPVSAPEDRKHSFERVILLAEHLSKSAYQEDKLTLNSAFKDLSYDQYRGIRFRRSADPFASQKLTEFGLDLLPPGRYYQDRVRISIVEKTGESAEIAFNPDFLEFDPNLFVTDNLVFSDDDKAGLSWSGFRLRFPINFAEVADEFVVFQGASYFRAVASDTFYGLSARGLALKTGDPEGEEFPRFSQFWIYRPQAGARSIHIDALLESASVTGAYHFEIFPGLETVFSIKSHLFPRVNLSKYGIAPLTSMYYFSPCRRQRIDDYRHAVHDSDGLAMYTGSDARLWRPLTNPANLQFSAFVDQNPQGFGFLQRARAFADYQDAEARYEKRPSAWIEPLGDWGRGNVSLIEIPADSEFNDNMIAFWNGAQTLEAGKRYAFDYQLLWSKSGPQFSQRAKVIASRIGKAVNNPAAYTVIIDYQFTQKPASETLQFSVTANKGRAINGHVLLLPDEQTVRASFEYYPEKGAAAELQAGIAQNGKSVAETWLYRWQAN